VSHHLARQAEQFHRVFAELVRAYQFRDREGVTCHGLSVSQCYALETLEREGPMAMNRLAGQLYLDVSTMTRIVDFLVAEGLAGRVEDAKDRRIRRVKITRKSRLLLSKIHADLIAEYQEVLRAVPVGSRDAVVDTVSRLLTAFRSREERRGSARPLKARR
jgi:DNA-binding MarR family transcriptional regulator